MPDPPAKIECHISKLLRDKLNTRTFTTDSYGATARCSIVCRSPPVLYRSPPAHGSRMSRSAPLRFAALALLALLAACADRQSGSVTPQEASRAGGPAADAGPSVHWRASLSGDVVVVEVQDRNNAYRVDKVELISPDGRSTLTSDITRERIAPGGRYNDGGLGVGVGGSGGSSGMGNVGVLFDIPLGRGGRADPIGSEARTTARIPLANPAAYRASADQWRVRISFSDLAGYNSTAVIPAPKPGS